VRDCAGFGDADGWRNCFYGDARQRSAGDIYFYDSGNGRNANPCDPAGDADGDWGEHGLYVDGHGQRHGYGVGGTERDVYIFGGSGEWDVWRECDFCLLGVACVDQRRGGRGLRV